MLASGKERPAPAKRVVREVKRPGKCLVVHLAGEIDFSSAWLVREQVTSAMDSAQLWRVVLDVRDVTFCDSSGLRALVAIWKAAESHGGNMTLARVPPACRLPLALTGLQEAFGVWPTIAKAVAGMSLCKPADSQIADELTELHAELPSDDPAPGWRGTL